MVIEFVKQTQNKGAEHRTWSEGSKGSKEDSGYMESKGDSGSQESKRNSETLKCNVQIRSFLQNQDKGVLNEVQCK